MVRQKITRTMLDAIVPVSRAGSGGSEGITMSGTEWIIAEVFVGLGFLVLLTAIVSRLMGDNSKRQGPAEILDWRYAQGELTHEQYQQMRQDLGLTISRDGFGASPAESRNTRTLSGTHLSE